MLHASLFGLVLVSAPPLPCKLPEHAAEIAVRTPATPFLGGGMVKAERDPFGVPNSLSGANFRVLWGDEDPVSAEEAQATLDLAEESWQVEIEELGYPVPT